jgi:hypothetical protein
MKDSQTLSRRTLLKAGSAALATVVIARSADAADEVLSASDPTAVALGYAEDASQVDVAKWPKKAAGADQQCSNCVLFAATADGMGKCNIFPGKLVNANGWCSAWTGK